MQIIQQVFETIMFRAGKDIAPASEILSVLLMILIMSLYEFIVYRVVSHRSMYNKSFHISIMLIPFFIGAIIMALQSNLIITLGTIGALAIIRFRTAVKDPVDMIYILWSIFIGIACGCQLYELCIFTSLTATIVLLLINLLGTGLFKNPFILVINCSDNKEKELTDIIKQYSKRFRLKSRNFTPRGVDYIYQLETKQQIELTKVIQSLEYVNQFSLLEYDNDDAL